MINLLAIDLQTAFMEAETWITAFFAWLGTSGVSAIIISLFARRQAKKIDQKTSVSEKQIEETAKKVADKAIKKLVGKSFNVNIKAEVDKAINAELTPIKANAEYSATASRNAEIATAYVLMAQSKSRLLKDEEKANLQETAKRLLSHANGEVIAPTVIEFAENENKEEETKDETTTEENASLVSFADIV